MQSSTLYFFLRHPVHSDMVMIIVKLLLVCSFLQARYKQSLDPTVDEVKKLCTSLRRNAKEERVLFHYTGHGVPRPTTNGEIWVFNKVRDTGKDQIKDCSLLTQPDDP